MSSSVDPLRNAPGVRRTRKSAAENPGESQKAVAAETPNLPVPVGRARSVPPKSPAVGAAALEAQLQGERRGLRAGAALIDQAKVSYNQTQWSGSKDRRAPKGRAAKTEI
jgi:hypothetical protein